MRKPFMAANWKMNHSLEKAKEFVEKFPQELGNIKKDDIDIAICVPYVYLLSVSQWLEEINKKYSLSIRSGAQNAHTELQGAYTGEISIPMIKDVGCTYVILGHSERRQMFHETDKAVSEKAKIAFSHGLLPIVCIGETLQERENGITFEIIEKQLEGSLAGLAPAQIEAITIAYEPVWAIGTGKAATPDMAQEVHAMIREYLRKHYGDSVAKTVRIQYGGSVKPSNVKELMQQPDIDGALVGGASLEATSFAELIKNAI
ncbi:MAG TPA: triose-phosphate isomerase [Planctomycetota bacterium]|nr:triose-phosphate isomerase [Planctomycetota bacterium]HQB00761.1 triose-phosphate isomerase [Planctomycetota bacterium]